MGQVFGSSHVMPYSTIFSKRPVPDVSVRSVVGIPKLVLSSLSNQF
jgi:hypothetical protein